MDLNNHTLLMVDTFNTLEIWQKLGTHQRAQLGNIQHVNDLLDLMDYIHEEWRRSANETSRLTNVNDKLNRQLGNYKIELEKVKGQNDILASKLVFANAKIGSLEGELLQYKQRFKIARDEFKNVALDIPNVVRNGKRSSSLGFLPGKRSKQLNDLDNLSEDDEYENAPPILHNRSISDTHIMAGEKEADQLNTQQSLEKCTATTTSTMDICRSPMVVYFPGWTKGRTLEQCSHNFVSINNLLSVVSTPFSYHCSICPRSLGIKRLKCKDCNMQIHENCKKDAPLPCVPMVKTPQSNNPKQRPRLADFCPDSQPRIPKEILRCVFAIERMYINNVGLYRVPGCDREVKELKEKFRKYEPKLEQLDSETVTTFIKKFLRDLREPLIPFSSFKEFYTAVSNKNNDQLRYAIETLPLPNRDTLAFLCAHWQKVAMHSSENQMPLENLAKVLGPTVVGTDSKLNHLQQPVVDSHCHSYHYLEASKQVEILYALLLLDNSYWTSFYNWQPNNPPMNNQVEATPRGTTTTIKRRAPVINQINI